MSQVVPAEPVKTKRAIEIAYDVFGDRGDPLVLIMGIGAQRVFWDVAFCEQFVAAGFQVVRFDHRDIGESSRFDGRGWAPAGSAAEGQRGGIAGRAPKPMPLLARRLVGLPVAAPYTLSDMADDVVGVLDELGWARAHLMGVSLGGMVGQHLAIEHPARVATLTSVMSTPGSRRYLPEPRALGALFAPPPKSLEEAGEHVAKMFSIIGSQAYPVDAARLKRIGERSYAAGLSPHGFLRHFAAVLASGDRSAKLRTCHVPTLVIHGTRDPMFPLRAGRDLANLMPDATWLPIQGMGHDLPESLWPTFVSAVRHHADGARGGTRTRTPYGKPF